MANNITYDEVEEIILKTEPPGFSDRDDQIWTRRMAVALADLFNARLSNGSIMTTDESGYTSGFDTTPAPQENLVGNNPYHREPSEDAREVALQAAADANDGYINGKTKRIVIAALNAFGDPTGNVAALKWSRSGWVEAFAKPEGLGFWYSIQPDKPVHGPGDPPFTCSVIWGEPGQNMRECLGSDFQTLEAAKAVARANFNKRIQSVLSPSPETKARGIE